MNWTREKGCEQGGPWSRVSRSDVVQRRSGRAHLADEGYPDRPWIPAQEHLFDLGHLLLEEPSVLSQVDQPYPAARALVVGRDRSKLARAGEDELIQTRRTSDLDKHIVRLGSDSPHDLLMLRLLAGTRQHQAKVSEGAGGLDGVGGWSEMSRRVRRAHNSDVTSPTTTVR